MADLSGISDVDLMRMLGSSETGAPPTSGTSPLASMSDDELLKALAQTARPPKADERGQWDNFKAGLSAIWDDPSKLGQVGPGRIVSSAAGAVTLPGDVATGRIDPQSDEAIARSLDLAGFASPVAMPIRTQGRMGIPRSEQTPTFFENPQAGGPRSAAPPAAAPVASSPVGNPVFEAAQRIEVPIPRGVATESRMMQAATQAARQAPIGGSQVENAVDASLKALSGAADSAAAGAAGVAERSAAPGTDAVGASLRTELERSVAQREALAARDQGRVLAEGPQGTAPTPAALGDEIRTGFQRRVDQNLAAQDEAYTQVRRAIDPDRPVVVSEELIPTLQRVLNERTAAAQGGLPRDLMPVLDFATDPQGVTFNGLQRARSVLGRQIEFDAANGGLNTGDLRAAYGALTEALNGAVQQAARGDPRLAQGLFQRAEQQFGQLAQRNTDLQATLAGGSEGLVNRLIDYSRANGNVGRMRQLMEDIAPEQRGGLSRLAFQKLGDDAGEFSLERFAREWSKMSPEGRAQLFGPQAGRIENALRQARSTTSAAREANADIIRMLGASDEQLARRVLAMATEGGSADAATLARLANVVGPQGMREVASLAIQNMGANRAGEFSPAFFTTNWQRMSESGKALLFADKGLRQSLDDIATVSARMAEVERKFANKSNTGRVVSASAMAAGFSTAPLTTLGTVIGSYALGRILSQPAATSSVSKWVRAYEAAARAPGAASAAALDRATRNLANTMGSGGDRLTIQAVLSAANENNVPSFGLGGMRSGRAAEEDEGDRRQRQ
jgi:hypothetical protein